MGLAHDTMIEAPARVIPILRSGVLAQDICRRARHAEVAAVFERSFYLRTGDSFLCVGDASIGNGPLTLVADIGGSIRCRDIGLRGGQRAAVSTRHIAIGDAIRFSLADCQTWRPPGWPAPPIARLIDACMAYADRAAAEAPVEGLAGGVFGASMPDTPFYRSAGACVARFEAWLSAVLSRNQYPSGPGGVVGLIGLGPGLTPSGDDFLSGALALLDALAERDVHAALARVVTDAAPQLTSPLSACFLRAAAAGHIGEYTHSAVAALLRGNIDAAVAAARRIGHSSGWDMLAGAATAMKIIGRHAQPG